MAPNRQRLENDVFTVGGIAQKYNCALKRLDWQQEQAFVSSLALGYNGLEIQRGMCSMLTSQTSGSWCPYSAVVQIISIKWRYRPTPTAASIPRKLPSFKRTMRPYGSRCPICSKSSPL